MASLANPREHRLRAVASATLVLVLVAAAVVLTARPWAGHPPAQAPSAAAQLAAARRVRDDLTLLHETQYLLAGATTGQRTVLQLQMMRIAATACHAARTGEGYLLVEPGTWARTYCTPSGTLSTRAQQAGGECLAYPPLLSCPAWRSAPQP